MVQGAYDRLCVHDFRAQGAGCKNCLVSCRIRERSESCQAHGVETLDSVQLVHVYYQSVGSGFKVHRLKG